MSEYIEREALIQKMRRMPIPPKAGRANTWLDNCGIGINAAIREVADFPAADVAPVVHGKWVDWKPSHLGMEYSYDTMACSECGYAMLNAVRIPANYCPNCGAKMDGDS